MTPERGDFVFSTRNRTALQRSNISRQILRRSIGHESSTLALEVYAKVMDRKCETGARMDELVRGPVFDSANGTSAKTEDEGVLLSGNKNAA